MSRESYSTPQHDIGCAALETAWTIAFTTRAMRSQIPKAATSLERGLELANHLAP